MNATQRGQKTPIWGWRGEGASRPRWVARWIQLVTKVSVFTSSLALLLAFAPPAQAMDITGSLGSTKENCGTYNPTDPSPHTFMVGDSITAGGKKDLAELRPNWEINGLSSRNVDCLPMFVSERLKHGYLGRLVIALGTNAVKGWGQDDYQAVVDMVPSSTVVLFVNTYRNADLWPATNPYRTRAGVQYFYSNEMAKISSARPSTCTAHWRQYAISHPEALSDGVHPNIEGREVWASIIDDAAQDCVRE